MWSDAQRFVVMTKALARHHHDFNPSREEATEHSAEESRYPLASTNRLIKVVLEEEEGEFLPVYALRNLGIHSTS